MKVETIIQYFIASYEVAKETDYVRKPMSFALYRTWKWCDEIEKERELNEQKKD